jgi:hypothetical protein
MSTTQKPFVDYKTSIETFMNIVPLEIKQSYPKTVSQFKRMKKNEVSWNSLETEAQREAKNLILSHKQYDDFETNT